MRAPADLTRIRRFMRDLGAEARGETRIYFTGGARESRVAFHHFDLAAQALAKIERGHAQDLEDVAAMLGRGLITKDEVAAYFDDIESALYRYPALDPPSFRRKVLAALA
jgi:hypothetical protein